MLSFIHILLLKLQCLSLLSLSFIVYLSSYNLYLLFSKYFFSVLSPILSSHSLPLIDCSIISSFHFISDHLITIHSFTYHLIYIHFISGKLGTIVQITVCQSTVDPRRIVIFANTHLFFHPAAAFARLLQTDVIISTCMYVRQCIRTQGLDCFKDLKINGEEIIEDYNDIDNDNGGKDESEQANQRCRHQERDQLRRRFERGVAQPNVVRRLVARASRALHAGLLSRPVSSKIHGIGSAPSTSEPVNEFETPERISLVS